MTMVLKYLNVAAIVGLIALTVAFVRERDQRLRAEGEAQVYLHRADSLTVIAESFREAQEYTDSVSQEAIEEAEERVAGFDESGPLIEAATDSLVSEMREIAIHPDMDGKLDSLETQIAAERLANEQQKQAIWDIVEQLEVQINARDQRIAALEQALAAEIAARGAIQQTGMGFTEKVAWTAGGALLGFALSKR